MAKTTFEIKITNKDNQSQVYKAPTKASAEKLETLNSTLTKAIKDAFATFGEKALGEVSGSIVSAVSKEIKDELSKFNKQYSNLTNKLVELRKAVNEGDSAKSVELLKEIKDGIKELSKAGGALKSSASEVGISNAAVKVTSQTLKGLQRAIQDQLRNLEKKINVKVEVDTKDAGTEVKKLKKDLKEVSGTKKARVQVDVAKDNLTTLLRKLEAVEDIVSKNHDLDIGVDLKQLQSSIKYLSYIIDKFDAIKASLSQLQRTHVNSKVTSDIERALSKLKEVQDKGRPFPKNITPKDRAPFIASNIVKDSPIADYKKVLSKELPKDLPKGVVGSGAANRLRASVLEAIKLLERSFQSLNIEEVNKALASVKKASEDAATVLQKTTSQVKRDADKYSKAEGNLADKTNKLAEIRDKQIRQADKEVRIKKPAMQTMSDLSSYSSTLVSSYKPQVIRPTGTFTKEQYSKLSKTNNPYEKEVYRTSAELAKSLYALQSKLFKEVSSGLEKAPTNANAWRVAGQSPGTAFKLRGKQWTMDIVNTKALQALTGKAGSPDKLLKAYQKQLAKKLYGKGGLHDVVSVDSDKNIKKIASWIVDNLDLENIDTDISKVLGEEVISALKTTPLKSISTDQIAKLLKNKAKASLEELFGATVGAGEIRKSMASEGLIKTLTLPAAKVTSRGTPIVETQAGRQRALSPYAFYKSGYEKAFDTYVAETKKRGSFNVKQAIPLAGAVRSLTEGTSLPENINVKDVTSTLVKALALQFNKNAKGLQGITVEDLKKVYKQAAVPISIERQRITEGTSKPLSAKTEYTKLNALINTKAKGAAGNIDTFIRNMEQAGLSANKVVASLDEVSFSDFYKILNKTLPNKLGSIIKYTDTAEKGIRDYEKTIAQLEGLMPIVELGKPRRGAHQSNVVKSVYQTSQAYNLDLPDKESKLQFKKSMGQALFGPEEQKDFIRKVNKRNRELIYEAKNLDKLGQAAQERKRQVPLSNVNALSSLGLPESTAGAIVDLSKSKTYNFETKGEDFKGVDELKDVHGKLISLYKEDLRALAPFGQQFQQLGRNISNVSSAKVFNPNLVKGVHGLPSEFPTLRSSREQSLIEAGRYGKQGYGFNVIAELNHTASTFEDQIVVSGKLADAITTATKKIVRPGASSGKATPITEKEISDVGKEIMSIMGVPELYKGRADKALIKDVKRELTTVRGATEEVQTAKIAEVFLNHFGRKFTTRYGSKGVAITPSGNNMAAILKKFEGQYKSIKVLTPEERKKSGLGVAMLPKSMGELAAEIVKKYAKGKKVAGISTDVLTKQLKLSGNKFLLELFKQPEKGLVTESEAKANVKLYEDVKKVFNELGLALDNDTKGITELKNLYRKSFSSKSLYKATPIDIRISSFGAAKRGLQPELLEMITNNLASTGEVTSAGGKTIKGSTVIQDKVGYKQLLGTDKQKGLLSKYSEALGYSGTGKSKAELEKAIRKMYGDKAKDHEQFIKSLVDLENKSNFYVDVIDELGKKHKSLVGTKFVQIIEDAKEFQEWSKGEIASGAKGLKLNLPAYAAYQSIFGPDSKILKQINAAFDTKQAEAYETLISYLANKNKAYQKKYLDSLKEVSLKDIKNFEGSFGVMDKGPNSLLGTVFDTDKFTQAFKLKLPTKAGGTEPFYVPSSILRQTFEDPYVAGGRGITEIGRALQQVITSAKSVEAYKSGDISSLSGTEKRTITKYFGGKLTTKLRKAPAQDKEDYINSLFDIAEKYATTIPGALPERVSKDNDFTKQYDIKTATQKDYIRYLRDKYKAGEISAIRTKSGSMMSPQDITASSLKELLFGAWNPKTGVSGASIVSSLKEPNKRFDLVSDVAKATKMSFTDILGGEGKYQQGLQKKYDQLEQAKKKYFETLAKSIVGKKGAVAQTLFTKKIPAVLAKATNAMVDKTKEFNEFDNELKAIEKSFGGLIKELGQGGFDSSISTISELAKEHKANVLKYKKAGLPVLGQHEIGVPEKLAKKLSVDYVKRYTSKGEKTEPTKVSSSLAGLLKYVNQLEEAIKNGAPDKELRSYIDKELIPYVESIRFPFTGTSSVQPYKAKLLKTQKGVNEDTLLVPGVPEMDISKFDKVFKDIRSKIEGAAKKREEYRTIGTPEANAKADELTKYIDALSKALSAALPKYIAQAQKLDYDGDQIEIHSATVKEAREEIKKHFDLLTKEVDSTAARFRDIFTYDAMQPSQGETPLAFAAKSYSKKFPSEQGFEYLKKPFVTENLSYLSNKEKISILARKLMDTEGLGGAGAVNKVMGQAFQYAGKPYTKIEGVDSLDEAAAKAAAVLDKMAKDQEANTNLIEGYIKESLTNLKLANAVNAQLFKLHTGTDVESLTKLMRAYESKLGFGGGEIKLASKTATGKLDQNFITRTRQTQLNEMYRFAVQKGMDVKHAGELPVAGELSKLVASGPSGVEELITKIKENDNYGGLKDFMEEEEKALRLTMGKYSTQDLKKMADSSNLGIENIQALDRKDLINKIVDKLGFAGFLRDLQKELENQALKSMAKELDKEGKPLGIEGAKKKLQNIYESGGSINVSKYVTDPYDVLYKYRRGGVTPDTVKQLPTDLQSLVTDKRQGAYTLMTKSFLEDLKNVNKAISQTDFNTLSTSLENVTFESKASKENLSSLSSELSKLEDALRIAPITDYKRKQIEERPDVVAQRRKLPAPYKSDMSDKELEKYYLEYFNFVNTKAILKERLKRIKRVSSSVKRASAPIETSSSSSAEFSSVDISSTRKLKEQLSKTSGQRQAGFDENAYKADSGGGGITPPTESTPSFYTGGGVVPVHLKSIEPGLVFKVAGASAAVASAASAVTPSVDIENLNKLAQRASGGANELTGATFETMYRASAFHGGGVYTTPYKGPDFSKQVEHIKKTMLGKETEGVDKDLLDSTSLIGTAIHEIVEKNMVEAAKAIKGQGKPIIEKFVSYKDKLGNAITGHIDAILTDATGAFKTAVDIKTVSGGVKSKVARAIKEAGSKDYEEVMKSLSKTKGTDYARYKIEEVRSQLNFYMKALQQEGKKVNEAEVHFYDRMMGGKDKPVVVRFKFDEELFKKDLKAIDKAREDIKKDIAAGKPISFAKTGSLDELKKASLAAGRNPLSDQETKQLLEGGTLYYKEYVKRKGAAPIFKDKESGSAGVDKARVKHYADTGQTITPNKFQPYEDKGLVGIRKNLNLLLQISRSMQESQGLGYDQIFKSLPKEAQQQISGARKGEVKAQDFYKYLEDEKILDQQRKEPLFDGAKISQAWKLFKDAQLDYLLRRAKVAEDFWKNAQKEGDLQKEKVAYARYVSALSKAQQFVRQNVGKRSDLFTKHKMWDAPEVARAAGVYMTPSEIRAKSAVDIEGDSKLYDVFKKITSDLGGNQRANMMAPQEKARYAVKSLTDMNDSMVELMNNGKLLERMGSDVAEAWDFSKAAQDVTRLREALELFRQYNVSDTPLSVERKNLDLTIKALKDAENKLNFMDVNKATSKSSTKWGETGVIDVPRWLDPRMQEALHKRNLAKIREYFKRPSTSGGAKVGETYIYNEKVFDQAGNAIKNVRNSFTKYADVVDATGAVVGRFSAKQEDLNKVLSGTHRGLTGAIRRAVLWGSASTIVYGGFSKLKESINVFADIESQMASLRMVMDPLTSNFDKMKNSAIQMAKQYGVAVTDVLQGMKIFAQQGLKEPDILKRTKTATLAANVTTLNAKDATEALTAAMKVFTEEGRNSLRFLDAWSEVESRHAITAGDMADAIKKAASAAKNAGFTFDQLNGIVAAIGSTTRQSGKEVGTSMRFIMRRLTSEKGPKALGEIGVPTMTGTGELRKGFDILSDLATKWDDLTNAQKMNIAQAIGGTRQYNALLVLMDNWQQALDAIKDSENSKGAAERKNIEIMKTYNKQVEQTKAALIELQQSVGNVAFPIFKAGLKTVTFFAETLSNVPDVLKAAGAAALVLVTYLAKGNDILNSITSFFSKGGSVFGDIKSSLMDELKIGAFELFGAGAGRKEVMGLKTITPGTVEGTSSGVQLSDFNSAIGKTTFLLYSTGKALNGLIASLTKGTSKGTGLVANVFKKIGGFLSFSGALLAGNKPDNKKAEDTTWKDLGKRSLGTYASFKGAKALFKKYGFKGLEKLIGPTVGIFSEIAGLGSSAAGMFVDSFSKKLGVLGDVFKKWAGKNAGLVEAIAPLGLTVMALTPALKALVSTYVDATKTADNYAESMHGLRILQEDELKTTRNQISTYHGLIKNYEKIKKASTPEATKRSKYLGTYKSPLLMSVEANKKAIKFANELAKTNSSLVVGYDKLGNAILKTSDNFEQLFAIIEKSKIKELAKTEIDIAGRYAKDLISGKDKSKFKQEMKALVKEVPAIGSLIADKIQITPAKALEVTTNKLNKLLAKKQQYSLSNVFDEDIATLQEKVAKLREEFNSSYESFKRSVGNIELKGLSPTEISRILNDPKLKEGFKIIAEVEPRLNVQALKGKTSWKDVLGKEVLSRVYPSKAGFLDYTKELTVANVESAQLQKRQGKVLSGDIVTFMDDVTKKYHMAGKQAIVELKKTSDGVFKWVATYFNTKTMKVETRNFDKGMQDLVEAILPTRKIEKDLSDRIDSLNEFVAGAGAGLRGISAKDFKRSYNLGERFFSDISTSTLIQSNKGFAPGTGFGKSPFQKSWSEDFKKYYAKPMEKYKFLVDSLKKLKLKGIDSSNVKMSTELYDNIVKLQNILKNNQVVMQYRAAFVDLTKTIEANTRATQENLAVTKSRLNLETETAGALKGKNRSLAQIDLGISDRRKLNVQERLLLENPEYEKLAKKVKLLEVKRSGIAQNIYAADKTKTDLASIKAVAKGFGTSLSPKDLKLYTETVARTGDKGVAELKLETHNVAKNTADTVSRLDTLIERFDKQAETKGLSSSFSDKLNRMSLTDILSLMLPSFNPKLPFAGKKGQMLNAYERVSSVRDTAVAENNAKGIAMANRALNLIAKKLADTYGVKKAADMMEKRFGTQGKSEFYSRIFSGLSATTLLKEIKAKTPNESKYFGIVKKTGTPNLDNAIAEYEKVAKTTKEEASSKKLVSAKDMVGLQAGYTVYGAFQRDYTSRKIDAIDKQLKSLRDEALKKGEATLVANPKGETKIVLSGEYKKQEESLLEARNKEARRARFYGSIQAASAAGASGTLLAQRFGLTEKGSKFSGKMASALALYVAAKARVGVTKEDLPESFKNYGKALENMLKSAKETGPVGYAKKGKAYYDLKKASATFMKDFSEELLGIKPVKETEKPKSYGEDYIKPGAEKAAKTFKEAASKVKEAIKKNTDATNKQTEQTTKTTAAEGTTKAASNKVKEAAKGVIKEAAKEAGKQAVKQAIDKYKEVPKSKAGEGTTKLPVPTEPRKKDIEKVKYPSDKVKEAAKGVIKEAAKEAGKQVIKKTKDEFKKHLDTTKREDYKKSDKEHTKEPGKQKKTVDFTEQQKKEKEFKRVTSTSKEPTGKIQTKQGEDYNRIAQVAAAAAATAIAKYLYEKKKEDTRVADLSKAAQKENTQINKIIDDNSKAAQKVYDELKKKESVKSKEVKAKTVKKSQVLDTDKEYRKTKDSIDQIIKEEQKRYEETTKDVEKVKEQLRKMSLAKTFKIQLEKINAAIKKADFSRQLKKQLKVGKGVFEGLMAPETINLGNTSLTGLDKYTKYQIITGRKEKNYEQAQSYSKTSPLKEYDKLRASINNWQKKLDSYIASREEAAPENKKAWDIKIKEAIKNINRLTKEQASWASRVEKEALKVVYSLDKLSEAVTTSATVISKQIEGRYSLRNMGYSGRLRGAPGKLNLGVTSYNQMSSTQYAFANAGKEMQSRMKNYAVLQDLYGAEIQKMQNLRKQLLVKTNEYNTLGGTSSQKVVKEQIEDLKRRIKDSGDKLTSWSDELQKSSKIINSFITVTDIMKSFEISVSSVKASFDSLSSGGLQVRRSLSNMYGGNSPFAPKFITPYDRYEASKQGVSLTLGRSNQFDIQRYQLLKGYREAKGRDKSIYAMKLSLLPSEKEAYRKDEALRLVGEQTRSQITPLTSMADKISEALSNPLNSFTKEQQTALESVRQMLYKVADTTVKNATATGELQQVDYAGIKRALTTTLGTVFSGNDQKFLEIISSGDNDLLQATKDQTRILARMLDVMSKGKFSYEQILKDLGLKAKKPASRANEDMPPYNTWEFGQATGGPIGSFIKGPGTGTSDSIPAALPVGSYIIKASQAKKAFSTINGYKQGGVVPVRVSNGELLLTPAEVQQIGGYTVADKLNKGYASGGLVDKLREFFLRKHKKTIETTLLGSKTTRNLNKRNQMLKEAAGFASGGQVFPEFEPPEMKDGQSVEEYMAYADKLEAEYNKRKAAWEKSHKKGFLSRLFGGSDEKPEAKQSFSGEVVSRVKRRNQMLKEAAGFALGGNVKSLKPRISDELLWQIAQATKGMGKSFEEIYGKYDISPIQLERRLARLSLKHLNIKSPKIPPAAFKKIKDKELQAFVGNKDLNEQLRSYHVINKIPPVTDNFTGEVLPYKTLTEKNKKLFYDKVIEVQKNRQKSIKAQQEQAKLHRFKRFAAESSYTLYTDNLKRERTADKGFAYMPSDYISSPKPFTTAGKLFKEVSTLFRFGDDRQLLSKFAEANNLNVALYGKDDASAVKSWKDASKEEKQLMLDSLVQGQKTLRRYINAYNETKDVLEKNNIYAKIEKLFNTKLSGQVFVARAQERDKYDLTGGIFDKYYKITAEYAKSFGYNQSDLDAFVKENKGLIKKNGIYYVDPNLLNQWQAGYMPRSKEEQDLMRATGKRSLLTPAQANMMKALNGSPQDVLAKILASKQGGVNNGLLELLIKNLKTSGHKHTGGMVPSTGKYFLEKGELVVSKNFKNGGIALSDTLDAKTISPVSTSITIDNIDELKKLVDELKSLEFKVDVGDTKVPVDTDNVKVEINTDNVKVPVDVTGVSIPVDMPDSPIKVDTTTLEESINKLTSIKLGDIKAVGAEKEDKLALVLNDLSSQLHDLRQQHIKDIQIVNDKLGSVESTKVALSDIQEKHQLDVAYLERQFGEVKSELGSLSAKQTLKEQELKSLLSEQTLQINSIKTHLYSVSARGGLNNGGY